MDTEMCEEDGRVNMETLYIVMPAYNEGENIEKTIREWYPVIEKYNGNGSSRLLIVDDGSKDDTYDKCVEIAKELPLFEVIKKTNSGHGPTVIFAYKHAIAAGADYVFQTDSDGQTNPNEFDEFWEKRQEYDGIFGVRTKRGDGKKRAFVEKIVCLLLKLYFGVRIPDANAPFRLMKADVLNKYLQKLPDNYNLPNIMITTFYKYYKEKTLFQNISFEPRTKGKNSVNMRKIIKIGWKALKEFRLFKKDMKRS